jgi:hypothetical protein
MPEHCHKALDIDFTAFLIESQDPMWEEFRQHYPQCEVCSAEVARWTKLEKLLKIEGKKTSATHPAEAQLMQFQQSPESLTTEEQHSIQQHLRSCPACKEELSLLAAFDFSLVKKWADEEKPVQAETGDQAGLISRLIIQIVHKGLKLLEQHLTPPLLDVQEIFTPMPAYRAEEGPSLLNLELTADQTAIKTTVVQDEDRIVLTMTFRDARQKALAGQQVFLRRQGRLIFSAKTDHDGVLRTPRLKPATYEIACPGVQTTFQLEFCS